MRHIEYPSVDVVRTSTIVALDLGRRTGWACIRGGLEPLMASGVYELYNPRKKSSDYEDGERFDALVKFLIRLHDITSFTHLAFEQVHPSTHKSGRQSQLWPGYRAVVLQWCRSAGIQAIPLHTATIKKSFAGNGRAGKEEMLASARDKGYLPFDDNECDALATLWTLGELTKDQSKYIAALTAAGPLDGLDEFRTQPPKPKERSSKKKKAAPKEKRRQGRLNKRSKASPAVSQI